jgi:cytochrome P450
VVIVNVWGLHRRPDVYPDAGAFVPERFTAEAKKARPRGAYLPFGAGPRVCIGNHFSLLEGTLVLAMIAQRFRFSLSPRARIAPEFQITMRPRHGVLVRVEAR